MRRVQQTSADEIGLEVTHIIRIICVEGQDFLTRQQATVIRHRINMLSMDHSSFQTMQGKLDGHYCTVLQVIVAAMSEGNAKARHNKNDEKVHCLLWVNYKRRREQH